MAINSVCIVGGTHGNEYTGTTLVKQWRLNDESVRRPSFSTSLLLANVKAHQANRRYLDQDLNRCFKLADLDNSELCGIEQQRAKVISQMLGPKNAPKTDFIIDLHTTTANMGVTIVINTGDALQRRMVAYLKQQLPHITVFFEDHERLSDNFLTSLGAQNGILVEVGPIAQGTINALVLQQTEEAVQAILDFIEKDNQNQIGELPTQIEAYEFIEKLKMPEDSHGNLNGYIHADRQNQDYQAIHKGDALFQRFDGSVVTWPSEETVYGAFINEAAYYDQNHGLSIMRKITLDIPH